jgi:hypothetical protein
MKRNILILSILVIVTFIGYLLLTSNQKKSETFLSRYDLQSLGVVEIINVLEQKNDEPVGFNASVTSTKLLLSDDKDAVELDIPTELFYLSVAPFINQTHPCATHSLVTCTGELQNETLRVLITDSDTDELILDQDIVTSPKGFAGLWLPSGKNIEMTITYKGLVATKRLSTFEFDDTCETTMQLS